MAVEDPLVVESRAFGGVLAPPTAAARLRNLLRDALIYGERELKQTRSGYEREVTVAFSFQAGRLNCAVPVPVELQVDPHAVTERGWLLVAATVGSLVELASPREHLQGISDLRLTAADYDGRFLLLSFPANNIDLAHFDSLVATAFAIHIDSINRLRVSAVDIPDTVLGINEQTLRPIQRGSLKGSIGALHPLQIAEAIARLGGRPASHNSVEDFEDTLLQIFGVESDPQVRPHEDPDQERRIARRILQRLAGMGKWGGYHTNFAHLARGFAGHERALSLAIGEKLISAGLLSEKRSVGQRHVYLNPRRAGDIYRLIESGEYPAGMR